MSYTASRKRRRSLSASSTTSRSYGFFCLNCNMKILRGRHTSVKCVKCSYWIHLTCSGLNKEDISDKEAVASVICKQCAPSEVDLSEGQSANPDNPELQEARPDIVLLKQSVDRLQEQFETVVSKMNMLIESHTKLSEQIEQLRLPAPVATGPSGSMTGNTTQNTCTASRREGHYQTGENRATGGQAQYCLVCVPGGQENPQALNCATPQSSGFATRQIHVATSHSHEESLASLYNHLLRHGCSQPLAIRHYDTPEGNRQYYVEVASTDYENIAACPLLNPERK